MVNRFLLGTITILTAVSSIFGYFFYRDVYASNSSNIDVGSCVPQNFDVVSVDKGSITVGWQTRDECSGYVLFGDSAESATSVAIGEGGSVKRRSHEVVIDDLAPGTTYYMYVYMEDVLYGRKGDAYAVKTSDV